jgi:alanine dehydrogenase
MARFQYPQVYPELKPGHKEELAKREVLLIDRHVAEEVLDTEECMAVLEAAYKEEGMGSAVNRTKANILVPSADPDLWYRYCTMEGGIRGMEVVAIRIKSDMVRYYTAFGKERTDWYCGFPGRFFGLILLFSARDGTPLALLHDAHMQHMRVAGTVTLATRHMARKNASVLGILGSGGMAWTHAYLLPKVRNIQRIKVYSPSPEHRKHFTDQLQQMLEIETAVFEDPREVVEGSDIVAACTNSEKPVIFGEWLKPGTHIILTKASKEMDEAGWAKVNRYVVYRSPLGIQGSSSEARWTAPPDWRFGGGTTPEHIEKERRILGDKIFDLPEVLLDRVPGRESENEITCTSNEGTGVQFAAVALKVYQEAKARGLGKKLPLEWFLQDVTN